MDRRFEYRSFFWPVVLIGVGIVWLLGNLGIIPGVDLWQLLRLWPLILIVIGLDILVGRKSSLAGALIGLGAVGVVIAVLVAGPRLGLTRQVEVKTERFVEPIEEATSAKISLNLSSVSCTVKALSDSRDLIDAEITDTGAIDFRASGEQEKTISLGHRSGITWGWDFSFNKRRWQIGLTPALPLALIVDGGSGSANLDLTGLKLSELNVSRGSGSFIIRLPESTETYEAAIDGGSGHLDLTLPGSTTITVRLSGGSGGQEVRLPSGAAVRVEVRDNGSGDVHVPASLEQVEGGDGEDEGTWETPGYADATARILIIVEELGSGGVRVR